MNKFTLFIKRGFMLILLMITWAAAFAQSTTVRGKVTDGLGGPLPGATIMVKGTQIIAKSDINGDYRLVSPATLTRQDILTFSFVGFLTRELAYTGNPEMNVQLREESRALNEVVVTALGIKREEKSLGYAAQSVSENAVKDARANNWVNSLSGKVAGLNIQGTGAGPMGSARITLRGESSLNLDNNQALIVLDGVPVSSKITGTGFSSHLSADSPVDYGSALSDINPDDIEKVTVLKGPGATALYGSRAAGGAIIITSKSGANKDKGIGITFNSNVSLDQVNRWPDYQFEYGEGRTMAYFSYLDSPDGPNTGTGVAAGRARGTEVQWPVVLPVQPRRAGK